MSTPCVQPPLPAFDCPHLGSAKLYEVRIIRIIMMIKITTVTITTTVIIIMIIIIIIINKEIIKVRTTPLCSPFRRHFH